MSNMFRLVCIVACALLAGCGGPEPGRRANLGGARPSADFVEGQRLFREQRYRDAEVCFRRAHEAEPEDREILDLLTKVELLSCSKPSYLRTCERGVSIEQEKAEVRRLFDDGQALLDAGDTSRAITRFEQVLEKIRWFPYEIDHERWKERAEQLLATARAVQPATTAPVRSVSVPTPPADVPTQPDFVEGMRHYEAFDYRKAADCFERARKAAPDDEVIERFLQHARLLCGDRAGCVW